MQEDQSIDTQNNGEITQSEPIDINFNKIGDESEISLPYIQFEAKQNIKTTSNVIFIPGIDGFARVFETIAANLESQSTVLQYVYSEKPESIQDMARLLALEKHLVPDKPFTIVAYSYGSVIALEAVNILESLNYHGTVVLIDGSPAVSNQILEDLDFQSGSIFETYILSKVLSHYIPSAVVKQEQENLFKCESWDARVEMTSNLIGTLSSYKPASIKLFLNGVYDRLKALHAYTPSYSKLKSKIILFKSEELNMRGFEEDFGVSKISEREVDVEVFDGNHTTILDNLKVAGAINSVIDS